MGESKTSEDAESAIVIFDKVQKLIAKYESTQDSHLLDEMRMIKPQLQEAIKHFSKLSDAPKDMAELNAIPAMAYNQLGGISLYLNEYSEAWEYYEKSRQLALKSGVAREIVQATNNLGSVALKQHDYDVALDQFKMALRYCSGLSPKDKRMRKQIERNIQTAKSELG